MFPRPRTVLLIADDADGLPLDGAFVGQRRVLLNLETGESRDAPALSEAEIRAALCTAWEV